MAHPKALLFLLWLLLLVFTGGASHPARLAMLALPLAVALPSALPLIGVGLLLMIPSAVELGLHGDWIGPFGARFRLVAGGIVAASAFSFGLVIRGDRSLRNQCAPFIPVVCVLLALQALLGATELLPPAARFLNGNHLAALALLLLAPVVSLGLDPKARWISLSALLLVLLLSTSRWGSTVAASAALLLIARERFTGRRAQLCVAFAVVVPMGLWALRSHFELSKLAVIRALYPITEMRPWSGVGPEGLERLSLRYLMAWGGRTTHGENIYLDWAAALGIPLTVLLITAWLIWCVWRLECDGNRTAQRMCRSSALVLLFLLVHELIDFSLTSGAVASMAGFLFAWTLPEGLPTRPMEFRLTRWFAAFLTVALPLLAWQFEPLRMEQNGSLETIDTRWGQHPHRISWRKARQTDDPELRIPLLATALEQAPGDGLLWLDFGDALYQSKRRTQAREAYRHGFSLLLDASRRRRGKALAQTLKPEEVWQVLRPDSKADQARQIPTMIGAAPTLLDQGAAGYAVVRRAEQTFANQELSRIYLQALHRPGLDPALVLEEAIRLLRSDRPPADAGTLLVKVTVTQHGLSAAVLTLKRLIDALPSVGCKALGRWPLNEIERLSIHRDQLLRTCGGLPSKDLHTENILSRIPRPVPQ